jgi:outer membrane protein assembly factor BamB
VIRSVTLLTLLLSACVRVPFERADAMSAIPIEKLGEDRLALHWKFITADHIVDVSPQEFASALVNGDTLYIGSASGMFYSLRASTGKLRWKANLGPVVSAPIIVGNTLYVGNKEGYLKAVDSQTGRVKWKYASRGAIEQSPVATGDLVVFANEADQVVALDATTGKYKWQFKSETPEEYTLRGHAGLAVDGELLFTGFSNGTLVALRRDTGSVAWSTSLKAEAERFMDVDATPIVLGDRIYASSSSGGVFALDKTTGLVRWRLPFYDAAQPSSSGNVGGLATDGKTIYVSVADLGTYAIDLYGNVQWRVGAKGGGEPAAPVIAGDLLIYSLAEDGLFLANRRTGETVEFFDPGDGMSASPVVVDEELYVMSNRGIVYAFDLN